MEQIISNAVSPNEAAFFSLIKNPVKFRLFLLKNLPAAYFSGVRLKEITSRIAIVSIPYKWFTRNPFRSTYFACLSMAAEMSTGILAMGNIYQRKPKVSMLVVGIEGNFIKKAVGSTRFICEDGEMIRQAINEAIGTKEPKTIKARSVGRNNNGEIVAEFFVTWSFKVRSS